jgi:hypothetical protein
MDPSRARDLIEGMARAREILSVPDPSVFVQVNAAEAAAKMGAEAVWKRVVGDDGRIVGVVGIKTARGTVWRAVETTWEDAWHELFAAD